MIKKYETFLNEKLIDNLSSLSEDKLIDNLSDDPDKLLELSFKYNLYNGVVAALKIGDFNDYDNDSIFKYMIEHDKYDILRKLLEDKKLDINEIDEVEIVNVFERLSYKKYQLLLLEHITSKFLLTEIFNSVIGDNYTEIINLILDKNIFDDDELNNYFIGINCGSVHSIETIEIFLNHGADINYENGELLLNALQYSNYDIIKFLIEHGAKFYVNKYFNKAIDFIINSNSEINIKIYELIRKYIYPF